MEPIDGMTYLRQLMARGAPSVRPDATATNNPDIDKIRSLFAQASSEDLQQFGRPQMRVERDWDLRGDPVLGHYGADGPLTPTNPFSGNGEITPWIAITPKGVKSKLATPETVIAHEYGHFVSHNPPDDAMRQLREKSADKAFSDEPFAHSYAAAVDKLRGRDSGTIVENNLDPVLTAKIIAILRKRAK